MATNVLLDPTCFEPLPAKARPATTLAEDVYSLGYIALLLLGDESALVSPSTNVVLKMLSSPPCARPTAAELYTLLAEHPLLV